MTAELVDVINYAFAIASLYHISLNDIIEKDKSSSTKYHHKRTFNQHTLEKQTHFVEQLKQPPPRWRLFPCTLFPRDALCEIDNTLKKQVERCQCCM